MKLITQLTTSYSTYTPCCSSLSFPPPPPPLSSFLSSPPCSLNKLFHSYSSYTLALSSFSMSSSSISISFFISSVNSHPPPPLPMVFAHDIYCTQVHKGSKRRQFLAVSPTPFRPTSFQGNGCLLSPALPVHRGSSLPSSEDYSLVYSGC